MKPLKQLGWWRGRGGVWWSDGRHYQRFSIARNAGDGLTVSDHVTGDLARVTTLAAARAWAGIRVAEQAVRHGE